MKLALFCALLLATAAVGTSCCSNDEDLITVVADNSAGIPHGDDIFPSDCRPPQTFVPVGK